MTLYDRNGKPTAYSEDGEHVFLFTGQPVAYFYENAVYGFNGHQLGWFENGWVRTMDGTCVFYSENATGSGPVKPVKQIMPVKNIKQIIPIKNVRQIKKIKAISSLSWSSLSGKQFFMQ